jgi:ABC-type Mn2+/Zn2+ transport system permease subunit
MKQGAPIKGLRRGGSTLMAFLGVYVLTTLATLALFGESGLVLFIPLIVAAVIAAYVWTHVDNAEFSARKILLCATVFGGVGFAGGFFGPLIFAPDANQGPLLGIFITGPIGVVIGIAYGLIKSWRETR